MTVETATLILKDLTIADNETNASNPTTDSPKFAKRRRPWSPRTIPRENLSSRDSSRKRPQRRRTDSEVSSRQHRRSPRHRTTSDVSTVSEPSKEVPPIKILKDSVTERYEKKGRTLLDSYLKNRREMVNFETKTKFLQKCKAFEIVPMPYRLTNFNIKNTKVIRRILDKFSLQLMFADLNYCRKRCEQIKKLLVERAALMAESFDEKVMTEILSVADETCKRRLRQLEEKYTDSYKNLVDEYKLTPEDIKAGTERLELFEQLDKERQERRVQKQQEKEQKNEVKPETAVEPGSEEVKKPQQIRY